MVLAALRRRCLRLGFGTVVALFACAVVAQERGMTPRSAEQAGVTGYLPARCHALLIGIDDYAEWPDLRCAAGDARAVAQVLRSHYGYADVTLLLDRDATRRGILRALDRYLPLQGEDSLLIFYAGHGWMDDVKNGYWVPSDAPLDGKADYLSNSQLVGDYFKKFKVKHLLVVADSCFSGALLGRGTPTRDAGWQLPAGFRKPSRFVLTSGDLQPVPDDAGAGHSPFTTRLIQYLRYGDDPAFGVQDLYVFVRKNIRTEPLCQPLDTPQHMPGGEYVFCRFETPSSGVGQTGPTVMPSPASTPPSGPVAVALTGGLTVKSPLAGTVTLDGAGSHAIRPDRALTWNAVGVGSHVVQVACASGTWRRTVEVKEGETLTVSAEFAPPEPPARRAGEEVAMNLGGGLTMAMVWVPPGSFTMGSPTGEAGRDNDETQHRVTLTKGFWMGKYEVTQRQWQQIMGNNPSHFTGAGPDAPVEQVSWGDCQEFVGKVNARVSGGGFRLPTEAEWEYACRAGTTSALNNGKELTSITESCPNMDRVGWYGGNRGSTTHSAGQKAANAWGLHDMHGNVWEWCQNWYEDYPSGSVTDPAGPGSGSFRVIRGGSWSNFARLCRSALRNWYAPGDRDDGWGCRLVRTGSSFPER